MPDSQTDVVRAEYATSDSLRVRLDTHRLHSETPDDLHARCRRLLQLCGRESILDVGPGPGEFQADLLASGHRGQMVGLDLSKGMAHEASTRVPTARWGVADAQALPLKNASFDRAVARHMLYHVPDIPSALRELKRVLRPRGRAVVTTNGAESLPSLRALRRRASEAFGLPAPPSDAGGAFSSKNASRLLRGVFDRVEGITVENALTFTEAAPAVRYVESTFTLGGVAADRDLRDALRSWLMAAVTTEIKAGRGVFRDPKYVAFYVAELE